MQLICIQYNTFKVTDPIGGNCSYITVNTILNQPSEPVPPPTYYIHVTFDNSQKVVFFFWQKKGRFYSTIEHLHVNDLDWNTAADICTAK